jgi:parallel beta-helix repeat protein
MTESRPAFALARRGLRVATIVAALVIAAAASSPADAAHIGCGAVLGAGHHVLDSDVVCPILGPIVTLTSGASLDLAGHRIDGQLANISTCLLVTGTGASARNGQVTGCHWGVQLQAGSGHRLQQMSVVENNFVGIELDGSHDNDVRHSEVLGNNTFGFRVLASHENRFHQNVVNDNFGTGLVGGYFLETSHDNTISNSVVNQNVCFGILLADSSRNRITGNTVNGSSCTGTSPAGNIVLRGDSNENVIHNNDASGSPDGDGINIGCRDGCGATGQPSTGADDNVVTHNTANNNARYGIAQNPGNTGNVFSKNTTTGNGVADFLP